MISFLLHPSLTLNYLKMIRRHCINIFCFINFKNKMFFFVAGGRGMGRGIRNISVGTIVSNFAQN